MRRSRTSLARLHKTSELRRLFRLGRTVRQGGLKLFYSAGSPGPARVAVCSGRGFRTAVDRNRSKRVSREAMRIFQERLVPGVDMALVGYPLDTLQTCLSRRQDQLRVLLERAELLEPRR